MTTLASTGDLETIRGRLLLVDPTDIRQWGLMDGPQMICHLSDAFGCPLGERPVDPRKPLLVVRTLYKWLALRTPTKWPQGVATMPAMDQRAGGTPPKDFAEDFATLLDKVGSIRSLKGTMAAAPYVRQDVSRSETGCVGAICTPITTLRQFGR